MTIPIIVIAGPSGCGKSSIAQSLSELERFAFIEGDDLHPKANIDKMANGVPLQDEDRWPWLEAVKQEAIALAQAPDALGVILTCSALKRAYRNVLNEANADAAHNVKLWFVFLRVPREELLKRLASRKGHYMKTDMLDSQLKDLEYPDETEENCKIVDVTQDLDQTNQQLNKIVTDMVKTLQQN